MNRKNTFCLILDYLEYQQKPNSAVGNLNSKQEEVEKETDFPLISYIWFQRLITIQIEHQMSYFQDFTGFVHNNYEEEAQMIYEHDLHPNLLSSTIKRYTLWTVINFTFANFFKILIQDVFLKWGKPLLLVGLVAAPD